jgi:hypothetical protein
MHVEMKYRLTGSGSAIHQQIEPIRMVPGFDHSFGLFHQVVQGFQNVRGKVEVVLHVLLGDHQGVAIGDRRLSQIT